MRKTVLSWEEYFLALAQISALRSKDPRTIVGACIVDEQKKVVALGYNGMPQGNDLEFSWNNSKDSFDSKHNFVIHAEVNAILNATKKVEGTLLYTTLFPCSNCAKILVQAGIKEIIFLEEDSKNAADMTIAKHTFSVANIKLKKVPKTPFLEHLYNF